MVKLYKNPCSMGFWLFFQSDTTQKIIPREALEDYFAGVIILLLYTTSEVAVCLFGNCPASATGVAAAAGSAACAITAAGMFSCFFITDHAADQQTCNQHDDNNECNIDEIYGNPV